MKDWVYIFGSYCTQDKEKMRNLLGGKGANLADMSLCGFPVPPGFTLTTEVCSYFYQNNYTYPSGLKESVEDGIQYLEHQLNKKFGFYENPLLLSVRSGARVSMPGMMDTVLNLGMNDQVCDGLAKQTTLVFARDSYRRFLQMYGNVVDGIAHDLFENALADLKQEFGLILDRELTADHWLQVIKRYKKIYYQAVGKEFPQDPNIQLWEAISAVFCSWSSERAQTYRRINNIPCDWGTAVNIQAMVFGNLGNTSATGVAFTRNPSTGEKKIFGEYLINAQGEDVVAGLRTPESLDSLEKIMPAAFQELLSYRDKLEKHYKDMQDIEFTIEDKKVYLLQTRSGQRTIWAALKIACDMMDEGLLTEEEAVLNINPEYLNHILHPRIDPNYKKEIIARGLPASPGAAQGEICFDAAQAEQLTAQGRSVILMRTETSPEDIHGIAVAKGVVTVRGGMTSHAAVVARGMGKPCIVGARDIQIYEEDGFFCVNNKKIHAGECITIDGGTGHIFLGSIPMIAPELSEFYDRIMRLCDKIKRMNVRANAETIEDARVARLFGAEGIGLCRTEHMFFNADRIIPMRKMIMANTKEERIESLEQLLPMQREDFKSLFAQMSGLPVTIRLLDPPLHEFLPQKEQEFVVLAKELNIPINHLKMRAAQLTEHNPMLGNRGCRLLNIYPEIASMQARAIFEAAVTMPDNVLCEIMIPLVSLAEELKLLTQIIHETAKKVELDTGKKLSYILGVMIELPRACLLADVITEDLSFISFGTNDLTQTTFGLSRDDAASFLGIYREKGLIKNDPFVTIDQEGVGSLMRIALKKIKPSVKAGICGEHGGDPQSINFCESIGLSYVSCSPFRVPIARLSAAQAYIRQKVLYERN